MKIELTEQQEQAANDGRPVAFVNPTTNRAYVLITAETFARVQAALEEETLREPRLPAQSPSVSPGTPSPAEGQPLCVQLRSLPTPPEIAARVTTRCRQLGLRRPKSVQDLEDELKLQYYFGGQYVGYLRRDDGPVVVAAGQLGNEAFSNQLDGLNPEDRRSVVLTPVFRWNDPVHLVLTPLRHEG